MDLTEITLRQDLVLLTELEEEFHHNLMIPESYRGTGAFKVIQVGPLVQELKAGDVVLLGDEPSKDPADRTSFRLDGYDVFLTREDYITCKIVEEPILTIV